MAFALSFVGGGNMARSLIGGLIARGTDPATIIVADPVAAQRETLHAEYSVAVTDDNRVAAQGSRLVVLAVKPQEMRNVTVGIANVIPNDALIVSVAAGIRASDIQRWAQGRSVVRCMPNRPALQGCGRSAVDGTHDVRAGPRGPAERK